jgi:hypothetical protein
MSNSEFRHKYCVIGAGAAGLAVSKYLKADGIPFDVIEAASEVGGIWIADRQGSPMYKNTHLISPKQVQAFSDFPMPEDYPDFPNHNLVLNYLRSYARHFGLYEHITFNTSVAKVQPVGNFWEVILSNGEIRQYRGVIIANGHHSQPKYPQFPGHFDGVVLHSRDYYSSEQLSGRRVLVVGAGQSAIDIVMEAAVAAQTTFHSTRRKFICLKKYLLGKPVEQLLQELSLNQYFPIQSIFRFAAKLLPSMLKLEGIDVKKSGIPWGGNQKTIYPIIGDKIYQYYVDGEVTGKPNIKELRGDTVLFEDGSEESIDTIIYATGYHLSFPFIEQKYLNCSPDNPIPDLFLYIFNPYLDNLFVIGMVNPLGAHWTVYEEQSRLVTTYLKAKDKKLKAISDFERLKTTFQTEENSVFNGLNDFHNYPLILDKMKYTQTLNRYIQRLSTGQKA